MSTLIEKLEKRLKKIQRSLKNGFDSDQIIALSSHESGFLTAFNIVKQHSDWISVDEQKPQDDSAYLVLCHDGSVWIGHYNLTIKPNDWYLHGWSAHEGWHPFVITYFMLPPKPPSEV